jgi:adenylyltransferase/sulfurtransferase
MPSPEPLAWEVDCQTLRGQLQSASPPVLVDCREQDEWDLVHLAGAMLVPLSALAERLGELESLRAAPLVVYCHHGGRSLRVAHWMRRQGFARAQSLAGGIDRWAQEIDPALPRY